MASIKADFDDNDSDESFRQSPGPGSYHNPSTNDTSKSENTQFQYFGSSSPRFMKSDVHKFPGPGTYKEKVNLPKPQQ